MKVKRTIIHSFKTIPIIDPLTYYIPSEILKLGFIPWFLPTQYWRQKLNKLIVHREEWEIVPYNETTAITMKTIDGSTIWTERVRWKVQGVELIKFLKLNNALPK